MKRLISFFTVLFVIASILTPAYAIDESRMYSFELLCDGSDECGGYVCPAE